MQTFLLISLGGVLGANARFLISTWAAGRLGTEFPYGTLLANIGGSLLIGLLFGAFHSLLSADANARLVLATGFLGAETTFSTFAYETIALVRFGDYRDAVRNVAMNVALGLAATVAGFALASSVTGGA
jgi:CrcB protein